MTWSREVEEPRRWQVHSVMGMEESRLSDVEGLLSAAYRQRVDDDYDDWHDGHIRGLYADGKLASAKADYRKFLGNAQAAGILPPWWTDGHAAQAVERASLQSAWDGAALPLRMFSDAIEPGVFNRFEFRSLTSSRSDPAMDKSRVNAVRRVQALSREAEEPEPELELEQRGKGKRF